MMDKPGKRKREYCRNGAAMVQEIRCRIDGQTARALTVYAKRNQITKAQAIRNIVRGFFESSNT